MEGAHQIARRTGVPCHDLLVVLGSGAADALAAWGEPAASLPLSDLPGVLVPVAPGHEDRLDSYVLDRSGRGHDPQGGGGVRVLVARGRTHLYEGRGPGLVVALAVPRPLPAYAGPSWSTPAAACAAGGSARS